MASTPSSRSPLILAGIFGAAGVSLGALGAHALQVTLVTRGMTHAWETAAKYHLLHTLALFAAAIWLHVGARGAAARIEWAVRCWAAGIVLFSGSLYWLALGGPRWLGPVTPFGGVALIAGWLLVMAAAFPKRE